MKLKFERANAKLQRLQKLTGKRVFTFSLLAGHSCPYANECQSRAVVDDDGKRRIQDGANTQFRCYAATLEVFFTNVYNAHAANMEVLKLSTEAAAAALESALPSGAEIVRIHPSGDFKTQRYFDAWLLLAERRPDVLFYAYTKSIPFWVKRLGRIPANLRLIASRGGHRDDLIDAYGLRSAVVVDSKEQASRLGLRADHDDSIAALSDESFALTLHGNQPAGTERAKIWMRNKKTLGYSRRKNDAPAA